MRIRLSVVLPVKGLYRTHIEPRNLKISPWYSNSIPTMVSDQTLLPAMSGKKISSSPKMGKLPLGRDPFVRDSLLQRHSIWMMAGEQAPLTFSFFFSHFLPEKGNASCCSWLQTKSKSVVGEKKKSRRRTRRRSRESLDNNTGSTFGWGTTWCRQCGKLVVVGWWKEKPKVPRRDSNHCLSRLFVLEYFGSNQWPKP